MSAVNFPPCNKQTKIIFLTNIQQTNVLLRKILRLRKYSNTDENKRWGEVIQWFLPSSPKWLEFIYADYLWLVLHRGSFRRCCGHVKEAAITTWETEMNTSCCWENTQQ